MATGYSRRSRGSSLESSSESCSEGNPPSDR